MFKKAQQQQPAPPSKGAAETAMHDYANATAEITALEAAKKLELNALEEKYRPQLNDLKTKLETAQTVIEEFVKANDSIFDGKKSTRFGVGTIGYRSGTPKLQLLDGWDWDKVKPELDEKYIRTVQEIDKTALLKDFKEEPETLEEVGLTITQEETFFIKL